MEDVFKNRLENASFAPPARVWNSIASSLDEWSDNEKLSVRLLQTEISPPASVFSRIFPEFAKPAAPIRRISTGWLRVAAAVAIIVTGYLLWPVLMRNQAVMSEFSMLSPSPVQRGNENAKSQHAAVNTTNAINGLHDRHELLIASHVLPLSSPKRSLSYSSIENEQWITKPEQVEIHPTPIRNNESPVIRDINQQNAYNSSYLSIIAPNGDLARISTKFASVLRYMNGSQDNIAQDENAVLAKSWQQRFGEWRQTLLRSSYVPASANFLDIVDLSEFLSKNQ